MTDKELRRLRRDELLEILLGQQREIDRLTAALADAEKKLEDREIKIMNAGSIAEASLALTEVFAQAQRAADIYIENIKRRADAADEEAPEQKAEEAAAEETPAEEATAEVSEETAAEEAPAEVSEETPAEETTAAEETITEEAGKPQEEEVKVADTPEGGETSV